jgi:hypothetical protein
MKQYFFMKNRRTRNSIAGSATTLAKVAVGSGQLAPVKQLRAFEPPIPVIWTLTKRPGSYPISGQLLLY